MSALDDIRIATPCRASWTSMRGDERKRFCAECGLHVYNLSALTRVQAAALIASSEQRTCVRLYRRPDGTLLTSDCPVGLRERMRARVAHLVIAGLAVILFVIWGASRVKDGRRLSFFRPFVEALTPSSPTMGVVSR